MLIESPKKVYRTRFSFRAVDVSWQIWSCQKRSKEYTTCFDESYILRFAKYAFAHTANLEPNQKIEYSIKFEITRNRKVKSDLLWCWDDCQTEIPYQTSCYLFNCDVFPLRKTLYNFQKIFLNWVKYVKELHERKSVARTKMAGAISSDVCNEINQIILKNIASDLSYSYDKKIINRSKKINSSIKTNKF